MKKIWIMNHYATAMLFNKGGRHYSFAKYLKYSGYEPTIFSCNTKNTGNGDRFLEMSGLWQEVIAEDLQVPFVVVQARTYKGNGKQRVLNMVDFYRNVKKAAKEYAKIHGKPDIILASSVHPLTLVAGIQLAKFFHVKCICEVRDLWPEAIIAYSKKIKRNSLLAKLMYAGEKWIYKKAAALIFTQEGGLAYICKQGWDKHHGGPIAEEKVFHINNGVDLDVFDVNHEKYPYHDPDLDNPDILKVVYAGAIKRVNNLGIILDAAKAVTNPQIMFLIFGDGDELDMLQKRVSKEKILNVKLKGRVDKKYIPSIVCKADINLVHWEMSPLLWVGESYNKSFEYFAAGKPVFYTVRPGYSIVEKYHCGRLTTGFSPEAIASGIQEMAEMTEEEKKEMERNARSVARIYDFKILTGQLIDVINTIS